MSVVLREEIKGGVREATGASQLAAGATSLTVGTGQLATWAFTTGNRFPVIINQGSDDEEHVYATGVSGDLLTGLIRGQDGTTDRLHAAGFSVTHGLFAKHIDLLNEFLSSPTAKGDIPAATAVDNFGVLGVGANNAVLVADSTTATGLAWKTTLAGLTLTLPVIADLTSMTHSHQNDAGGGVLAAAAVPALVSAWSSYTAAPTASGGGFSLGNGTGTGRSKQVGKIVTFTYTLTYGSTTAFGTGRFQFPLPLTAVTAAGQRWPCQVYVEDASGGAEAIFTGAGYIASGASFADFCHVVTDTLGQGYVGPAFPVTFGTGDIITVSGIYESSV